MAHQHKWLYSDIHVGMSWKIQDKRQIKTLLKLSTTQKKQTTQNTAKQNNPGLVIPYDTWPGNEVGLFYNALKPRRGSPIANVNGQETQTQYKIIR